MSTHIRTCGQTHLEWRERAQLILDHMLLDKAGEKVRAEIKVGRGTYKVARKRKKNNISGLLQTHQDEDKCVSSTAKMLIKIKTRQMAFKMEEQREKNFANHSFPLC